MRPCVRIDALPLLGEGGISNYVRPLVEHLIGVRGSRWDVELFFRLGFRGRRRPLLENWLRSGIAENSAIRTSCLPDRVLSTLWQAGYGGLDMGRRRSVDVVLATTEIVPCSKRSCVGWFVYDLNPLLNPQFFNGSPERLRNAMCRRAERADFIVALSECTRRDTAELLGYPAEKIAVVYPGMDVTPAAARSAVGSKKQSRPYILYLGALALNKNVDGLLRIFARLIHNHRMDLDLVLTGKDFCGSAFWAALVCGLRIEQRVHFVGWVSEAERESLLAGAAMLWQLSWYEGFGLPVLEAAGRGVPVLCTNRGAVPEILRSPEQEVDPADEAGAAERAAEALKSPATLAYWRERGLKRAAEFSWSHSVDRLSAAIEAAMA